MSAALQYSTSKKLTNHEKDILYRLIMEYDVEQAVSNIGRGRIYEKVTEAFNKETGKAISKEQLKKKWGHIRHSKYMREKHGYDPNSSYAEDVDEYVDEDGDEEMSNDEVIKQDLSDVDFDFEILKNKNKKKKKKRQSHLDTSSVFTAGNNYQDDQDFETLRMQLVRKQIQNENLEFEIKKKRLEREEVLAKIDRFNLKIAKEAAIKANV